MSGTVLISARRVQAPLRSRSFFCGWTADVSEERAWPAADELFQHAPCGLLVTGEDGMIRRVNRRAKESCHKKECSQNRRQG